MVTVADEVRMAIRPKLDLALIIALVIGAPITPVAPMTRTLRVILRCRVLLVIMSIEARSIGAGSMRKHEIGDELAVVAD